MIIQLPVWFAASAAVLTAAVIALFILGVSLESETNSDLQTWARCWQGRPGVHDLDLERICGPMPAWNR